MTELSHVEAGIVELAIRKLMGADVARSFRREAADLPAMDPRATHAAWRCYRHGMNSALSRDDPPMVVRVPTVPMVRQTWTDGRETFDIWLGQCPDCGTVYQSIERIG